MLQDISLNSIKHRKKKVITIYALHSAKRGKDWLRTPTRLFIRERKSSN